MMRRLLRALWPLGILLVVFAGRAAGCRNKEETGSDSGSAAMRTSRQTPSVTPTQLVAPNVTLIPVGPE